MQKLPKSKLELPRALNYQKKNLKRNQNGKKHWKRNMQKGESKENFRVSRKPFKYSGEDKENFNQENTGEHFELRKTTQRGNFRSRKEATRMLVNRTDNYMFKCLKKIDTRKNESNPRVLIEIKSKEISYEQKALFEEVPKERFGKPLMLKKDLTSNVPDLGIEKELKIDGIYDRDQMLKERHTLLTPTQGKHLDFEEQKELCKFEESDNTVSLLPTKTKKLTHEEKSCYLKSFSIDVPEKCKESKDTQSDLLNDFLYNLSPNSSQKNFMNSISSQGEFLPASQLINCSNLENYQSVATSYKQSPSKLTFLKEFPDKGGLNFEQPITDMLTSPKDSLAQSSLKNDFFEFINVPDFVKAPPKKINEILEEVEIKSKSSCNDQKTEEMEPELEIVQKCFLNFKEKKVPNKKPKVNSLRTKLKNYSKLKTSGKEKKFSQLNVVKSKSFKPQMNSKPFYLSKENNKPVSMNEKSVSFQSRAYPNFQGKPLVSQDSGLGYNASNIQRYPYNYPQRFLPPPHQPQNFYSHKQFKHPNPRTNSFGQIGKNFVPYGVPNIQMRVTLDMFRGKKNLRPLGQYQMNSGYMKGGYPSQNSEEKGEDYSNKYKTEMCKNFELTGKCQWADMVSSQTSQQKISCKFRNCLQ